MVALENLGGLDTLPGGGNLDQDAVLGDALLLVELGRVSELSSRETEDAYIDDLEGLVDGSLGVKGELGVNLGGDTAGNDLENLLAKLDEEAVEGVVNLSVDVTALGLGVGDGIVNQLGVLGLLGSGEDERRVGGGILGLVLVDGWERLALLRSGGSC